MQIHQLSGYIQCIYLVQEGDQLMLLDGASRADVTKITHFIKDTLNLPLRALRIIAVTHMHPDHAGAALALRKLTGAQILTCEKSSQWYAGISGTFMHVTDILLTFWVANRLGKPKKNIWYKKSIRADIQARDGDPVPGFPDWQVVESPGHTDRDISLYHVPSRQIYVADVMVKVRNRFIPPFPVFHPNQYRNTLKKLRHLAPDAILLAHGGKVSLSEEQYDTLESLAPRMPKTHWRATKHRVLQMLLRQSD